MPKHKVILLSASMKALESAATDPLRFPGTVEQHALVLCVLNSI